MPACYCKYRHCNGEEVDKNIKRIHDRFDASQSYHDHTKVCQRHAWVSTGSLCNSPLIQHNAKGCDVSISLQSHLPGMVPGPSARKLETSCNLKQSQGHAQRHQPSTVTAGRISVQTSDPKLMQSLVILEQNAKSQRKAALAFQSCVLVSQPTKALLDKIKAHQKELATTLAKVTVLWCQHGTVVMRLQEDLKMDLQKSIKDIDDWKHSLIGITATGTTIIRAQQPGEDCGHECITY